MVKKEFNRNTDSFRGGDALDNKRKQSWNARVSGLGAPRSRRETKLPVRRAEQSRPEVVSVEDIGRIPRYSKDSNVYYYTGQSKHVDIVGGDPTQVGNALCNMIGHDLENPDPENERSIYPVLVLDLAGGAASKQLSKEAELTGRGIFRRELTASMLLKNLPPDHAADVVTRSLLAVTDDTHTDPVAKQRIIELISFALSSTGEDQKGFSLRKVHEAVAHLLKLDIAKMENEHQGSHEAEGITMAQREKLEGSIPSDYITDNREWLGRLEANIAKLRAGDNRRDPNEIQQPGHLPIVYNYIVSGMNTNQEVMTQLAGEAMVQYLEGIFPAGHPQRLVLIGAERLQPKLLQRLSEAAKKNEVPQILVYRQIFQHVEEMIMNTGSTLGILRIANDQVARAVSRIIGTKEGWKQTSRDQETTTTRTTATSRVEDAHKERRSSGRFFPKTRASLARPETRIAQGSTTREEVIVTQHNSTGETLQEIPLYPSEKIRGLHNDQMIIIPEDGRTTRRPIYLLPPAQEADSIDTRGQGSGEVVYIEDKIVEAFGQAIKGVTRKGIQRVKGMLDRQQSDQKQLPEGGERKNQV